MSVAGAVDTPLELAAFAMLTLALVLTVVRLALGPTIADRVVALDVLTTMGIALIALYAVVTEHAQLVDVALTMGLIAFITTVAFAYLLERATMEGGGDERE